jgi:LacI family transcriptional regulator, galactose operon repressor
MKQYTTLKKISEKMGVSISTVSRALQDHPDISRATREKIKRMAEMMHYEPNTFATSLRTNETKMLGVIVPIITNFFYEAFVAGIEEEARKNGYSLLVLQSGENVNTELKNLEIMRKNRVDGIFVTLTCNTKDIGYFKKVEELGIPVIFADNVPDYEACNRVRFDDEAAAIAAAKAIIDKKKKYVLGLFYSSEQVSVSRKRLESFNNYFREHAPDTLLEIHFHKEIDEGNAIVSKAIHKTHPPDTIFCIGDNSLVGSMIAIQNAGLHIPEDISIISISNGLIPRLYRPKITYIKTSGRELAQLAFSRLMEIFKGRTFAREQLLPVSLIMGESL